MRIGRTSKQCCWLGTSRYRSRCGYAVTNAYCNTNRDSDANSYSHRHSKIYSGHAAPPNTSAAPESLAVWRQNRISFGERVEDNAFHLVDGLILETMTEQFAEGAN